MSFRANDITTYDHEKIAFGIDQKKAAAQLRRLADEIEKPVPNMGGEYILLQEVTITEVNSVEDFSMTTITLQFATKKRG
jgi:hypothetical protein